MQLPFLLHSAYLDLQRNRGRTLLTSLGILIGVFAVMILMSLGVGLQVFIKDQFTKIGTNLVIVFPGNFSSDGGGFQDSEGTPSVTEFDQQDFNKLKRLDEAKYIAPAFIKVIKISAGKDEKSVSMFASTGDIFPVQNSELNTGQLFTKADVNKGVKVVVLGSKVAEKLFGSPELAIGKKVNLDGYRFTVKGVLKAKGGGVVGPNFDTFVYVPYTGAYVLNPDKIFVAFYIKAIDDSQIPLLKDKIKAILNQRYAAADYSVIEQTEIMGVAKQIFGMINLVLVALGSISLIVGGIGIMNIMYASVTERTKEVGIRRALGATENDILQQFVSEAVVLSVFGGLLGLTLAWAGVLIARHWFPARMTIMAVTMALGVSSIIGIFFGVFPARRAASLTPIEAIRKR